MSDELDFVSQITGSEKVFAAFGRWPRFHDAEVLRFSADRAGPLVRVVVHCWESLSETDPTGHFVRTKFHLITFRFDDVRNLEVLEFNHQNAIDDLNISRHQPTGWEHPEWHIEFLPAYGFHCRLICGAVTIVDVEPVPA